MKRTGLLSSEAAIKVHLGEDVIDDCLRIGPVTHHPRADLKAYGPLPWQGMTSTGFRARGQFPPIKGCQLQHRGLLAAGTDE